MLTQSPGEVELGPRSLYGEESIGEPGQKGGMADKIRVHVVLYRQGSSHDEEEEHTAAADQQFSTDRDLQR